MPGKSSELNRAYKARKDEFYTQLTDIEKECAHYKNHFKGKVIFCNCDDPEESNFWKYFYLNFEHLGLKKLISTHFEYDKPTYKLEYDGSEIKKTDLKQNGDFRSPECIELLDECDIVCTNPPFSLFREFVAVLMEHMKNFLIIGNVNCITYKEFFPLLKDNKVWVGFKFNGAPMKFKVPKDYPIFGSVVEKDEEGNTLVGVGGTCWYTNLDINKRHEELILYKKYSPEEYPTYINFNAINVDKTKEIPCDYDGLMGVPVSFMNEYNPEQFEIVGFSLELAEDMKNYAEKGEYMSGGKRFYIKKENGKYKYKRLYDRLVIRRKM